MKELYSAEAGAKWKRKARRLFSAVWLTAGLGLGLCIALCCLVNTKNASLMLGLVIGLSTLAGWAVMLELYYGFFPLRAQAEHDRGILSGESSVDEGSWQMSREPRRIPRSVSFYQVKIGEGEEARTYNLNARFRRDVPPQGARVRVRIVRKFITAYEVLHEEA